MRVKTLERIVQFNPAYDRRDPDPSKNYGIHGVNLRMIVKGERGATQFLLYTNWMLPSLREEMRRGPDVLREPMPADLGYHSIENPYPGEEWSQQMDCDILGKCYYDGSSLNAIPVFDLLVSKGDEAVWKHLEDYYESRFGQRT